jgi:hypothetical protein
MKSERVPTRWTKPRGAATARNSKQNHMNQFPASRVVVVARKKTHTSLVEQKTARNVH